MLNLETELGAPLPPHQPRGLAVTSWVGFLRWRVGHTGATSPRVGVSQRAPMEHRPASIPALGRHATGVGTAVKRLPGGAHRGSPALLGFACTREVKSGPVRRLSSRWPCSMGQTQGLALRWEASCCSPCRPPCLLLGSRCAPALRAPAHTASRESETVCLHGPRARGHLGPAQAPC